MGAPDDPREREADDVADAVMRMPEPVVAGDRCTACEEDRDEGQDRVRLTPETGASPPAAAAELGLGSCFPLPTAERAFFEPRLGRSLADVRVHADRGAAEAAQALEARAFAYGRDIAFALGAWQPWTSEGRRLLAHELAHVAQQGAAPVVVRRQPVPTATPPGARSPAVTRVLDALARDAGDTDDLAHVLSDAEMRTLTADERVRLVSQIAGGTVVGDEDEQTIIRLLRSTPDAQAAAVVAGLGQRGAGPLRRIDSAVDFAEYDQLQLALRELYFRSLDPEAARTRAERARVFPWSDPGLIGSMTRVRYYYEKVDFTDQGRLRVTVWQSVGPFGMKLMDGVELDPFETVKIVFVTGEQSTGAHAGQAIFAPAMTLRGMHRAQFRRELATAVDVGLLVGGVAGIAGAATRIRRLVAVLEVAFSATDLVVRDQRDAILALDHGPEFLAAWDIVSMLVTVYGVGRAVVAAPRAFQGLRRAWSRFRAGASRLPPEQARRLEAQVEQVVDQAEDIAVGEAGTRQGGGGTPAVPAQATQAGAPAPSPAAAGAVARTAGYRRATPEIWHYEGREIVVMETSAGPQPFYRRTGLGSARERAEGVARGGAQGGQWAPFDGFLPGWFDKARYVDPSVPEHLRRYGTEEFRSIGQWLDAQDLPSGRDVGEAWGQIQEAFRRLGVRTLRS